MDSKVDAVVDRLLTAIDVGEYLPGSKLPAERDLAVVLGVSRSTVREAIGRLAEEGIVRVGWRDLRDVQRGLPPRERDAAGAPAAQVGDVVGGAR